LRASIARKDLRESDEPDAKLLRPRGIETPQDDLNEALELPQA
jgi:hypothetical protein